MPESEADPLMAMGWQPQPPAYYSFAPGAMAAFPGLAPGQAQAAAAGVPTEASMLGELKNLIAQLDQQTKATMKDSLYRISRHAQVRHRPKACLCSV